MYKFLLPIFSAVCGENPQHIWSPGGQPLPCCQRCTGLYVAALVATALHLWFRPRISKGFLQIHAFFLLQLGLFLFPWLPSSPVLRTLSGSLFGFGVVAFLGPAIFDGCPPFKVSRFSARDYALGVASCLGLVPAIAEWGGRPGAFVLMCLVLAGALALAALAAANLTRCLLPLAARKSGFAGAPCFWAATIAHRRHSETGNLFPDQSEAAVGDFKSQISNPPAALNEQAQP